MFQGWVVRSWGVEVWFFSAFPALPAAWFYKLRTWACSPNCFYAAAEGSVVLSVFLN